GALVFVRDISERKKSEEELRHFQKIEAIGLLAGGIAHDFNNMLAGIMGNAEFLSLKLHDNSILSAYVKNIITAAEHAASLTRQLLTFARKGQVDQHSIDIHQLIDDICNMLEKTIDRRILINRRLGAPTPIIIGDPSQIENMLLNLGINARDAMADGGLLTFSTAETFIDAAKISEMHYAITPGIYIRISVTDTGHGMDNQIKQHIFEPFFTTKAKGKGTGLGLAGVYGTVMSHNGMIEVKSEPGKGTVFDIYLPVGQAEVKSEIETEYSEKPITGSGRILLVDDEEMIRQFAENLLTHVGYKVHTCSDGPEAIGYYNDHFGEIELVILDMMMPILNGKDTFLKLKSINHKIKVLISSGYVSDVESEELIKIGVSGFVGKPYHLADLASKVKQVIEKE
ncbi:MAG: ATP-binding protein, partial [bacterium]